MKNVKIENLLKDKNEIKKKMEYLQLDPIKLPDIQSYKYRKNKFELHENPINTFIWTDILK